MKWLYAAAACIAVLAAAFTAAHLIKKPEDDISALVTAAPVNYTDEAMTATPSDPTIPDVTDHITITPDPTNEAPADTEGPTKETEAPSNTDDAPQPVTPTPGMSTPDPTEKPAPTAGATAGPTASPVPTATPAQTNTPGPTGTPVPTNTPAPTGTPVPTNTPGPTNTPKSTATPAPTNTPGPVETLVPTNTPDPTITPKPWSPTPPPGQYPSTHLFFSEEEFIEAVLSGDEYYTAISWITHYYKPAQIPSDCSFHFISGESSKVGMHYECNSSGSLQGFRFDWFSEKDPNEVAASAYVWCYDGSPYQVEEYHGRYIIRDPNWYIWEVYWAQDGQVFHAKFWDGFSYDLVDTVCNAQLVTIG